MAITVRFQLCSAHSYTALQMKNSRRSTSAINLKIQMLHIYKHKAVSKKGTPTKKDKGKSMMCALYMHTVVATYTTEKAPIGLKQL